MAIIEKLGLQVKVKVNGAAAAEYPDKEPDDNYDTGSQTTHACRHYVESFDNAEFAIHVGLGPGTKTGQEWISRSQHHSLCFSVAFDGGHDVAATLVSQHHETGLLEGIRNHENQTLRRFIFAPVTTVDDANKKRVASDMRVAQNLGLIRVSVCRVMLSEGSPHQEYSRRSLKFESHGSSLAEQALKGKTVSHGTALSAPEQSNRRITPHVHYVDRYTSPLAVFYFKYRSKEALQQELIITRPRSLSMESDLENLPAGEIRRLARERLSQIKDGKKRAVSVKDEDDTKTIKSDRPFKFVRIEGGRKAIDLTEDD